MQPQEVVYSSPAYIMIRRLFESFYYRPDPDVAQTNVPALEIDTDGNVRQRDKLYRQEQARQRALAHMDRHMVLLGEEGKILDLLWDLLNNSIIIFLLVGTSQLLLPSGARRACPALPW